MKKDFQKMYLLFLIFRLKNDETYEGKITSMSPYEVNENLEELNWRRDDFETNGWQQDTWMTYYNKNYPFKIVVVYSGYYGSMYLYRKDEE